MSVQWYMMDAPLDAKIDVIKSWCVRVKRRVFTLLAAFILEAPFPANCIMTGFFKMFCCSDV